MSEIAFGADEAGTLLKDHLTEYCATRAST